MRIPDEKIEEVRTASDIVDVISSVVSLKKRGKNYLGLCPFHQEKTPSFTVSAEKQMYHCFGCGVGGNVFTFVMEHEKVSFVEAVRTLAERAGIALPAEGTEDRARATENEALYAVCRRAALYFHDNLLQTVEGQLALEYFHHRGFSDETIRIFGLGYAMNGWDALVRYGEKEGLETSLLDKSGLILRREDGSGFYDRFRGRAMFPFLSPSGRVVGFGARKLREDDPLGKYINSPETPIYDKSRNLYGLYQSKEAIRERESAILVEGYADLISVFQAGIRNIVASSGTALTVEQIQLLRRYTKNIFLVYDADSAGSKAMLRGVDLIIEQGLDVRVVELPEGEDPDSLVRKEGGDEFTKRLQGAMSFLDFKAGMYESQGLMNSPEGKAEAVRGIVETIAKMKDEIKRSFYIKSVSERFGIYESVLYREIEKIVGVEGRRSSVARPVRPGGAPAEAPVSADVPRTAGPAPAAERDLLKLLLSREQGVFELVFSHLRADLLTDERVRRIFQFIQEREREGRAWEPDGLAEELDDAGLQQFIAGVVFSKYEISKAWSGVEEPDSRKLARDCIARIRMGDLEKRLRETHLEMKAEERAGGSLRAFQEKVLALQQEKREIQSGQIFEGQGDA